MKKAICLTVLFTVFATTGCGLVAVALSPPVGATPCTGDEECPAGYRCATDVYYCIVEMTGDAASAPDHRYQPVDSATDAVSADGSTGTDSSQSDAVDAGRADATSADTFAPDTTAPDTTHAPDSMGHDTAVVDSARADSSDASQASDASYDAGSEDAFTPECVERDTTCMSLYGADYHCWQGRCVLANASYCGPFSFMAQLDTGCTEVIWRIYGYVGPNPVREILHGEPGVFYDSIPGVECSAEAECAAPNMGSCRTIYTQMALVGLLCPWDLGHP